MTHQHLIVPAQTIQLKRVRDAVMEVASPLLGRQAHMVALAVDEAVANVILHGGEFQGPADDKSEIQIDIDAQDPKLEVRIVDDGPAFDPCNTSAEDPVERTLNKKRGGMGMGIMRQVMDEIHYARLPDESNELRLIKYKAKKTE